MNPAFSVIFFTTLTGAGQGLFIAVYSIEMVAALHLLAAPGSAFYVIGGVTSVTLTGFGLFASFFHLGRPRAAWRSAARWRTSWLSREVIAVPAFMAAVTMYTAAHHLEWPGTQMMGAGALVICLALFLCTGMIYACIKFLQEWATPLTVVNYTLLGSASGFMLATAIAQAIAPQVAPFLGFAAGAITLMAWIARSLALARNARLKPKSTIQSATGIKHPRIAQIAMGFMGGSFNTREFFHGRTLSFLRGVKWAFLLLAFAAPTALLGLGVALSSVAFLSAACGCQYIGLIAERWFFFAQANHPQNLYYQIVS